MPVDRFGPEEFRARAGVSRETLDRFKIYAAMLAERNARTNLVSEASLKDVWRRHFWDSAQLGPLVPDTAKSLADLGAGAGFPGLVLAELLRDRKLRVVLFEATAKKCRFLKDVARKLQLDVEARNVRIESAPPEQFDVVTARACAPLSGLLAYAQRLWGPNTVGLFLKGQNVGEELTEAHKSWSMKVERHASRSDPSGTVLQIAELRRVA